MASVEWSVDALKDLEKIDTAVAERIIRKTVWLEQHFADLPPEGLRRDLKGFFKLRIGDYRAVYSVRKDVITITKVGHRSEVYD